MRPTRGCYGKWSKAVLSLKPGQYFTVETLAQQIMVLNAAKSIGINMSTRKTGDGIECVRKV